MKFFVPSVFVLLLLAGMSSSCKHNPVVPGPDTTHKKDTSHVPCDTCKKDTTTPQNPNDTSSHSFTWTQSTISGEAGLTGCWVLGPNDIYVVGGSVYKSTDGKTWNIVNLTDADRGFPLNGGLSGCSMFGFAENDFWLTEGDLALHFDGNLAHQLRTDSLSGKSALHSAWGISSSDMYFVGDGGTILHFDGTNWTRMNSGTTNNLQSI